MSLRWRRVEKLWYRTTGPKVLVASVPKCGTHLLRRTLSLFPQLTDFGDIHELPSDVQGSRIDGMRRGGFLVTHSPPDPAVSEALERNGVSVLFGIRDPRDACVSHYHYYMREAHLKLHEYYRQLPDDGARLMATIVGVSSMRDDGTPYVASIDTVFRSRAAWLTHTRALCIRFEDLVGSNGGGDAGRQVSTVMAIAEHVGVSLSAAEGVSIAARAFSAGSPTFRKGTIGQWRQEMTECHRSAFKGTAGELLIELGYECDYSW